MIDLAALAALADDHRDLLRSTVAPVRIGGHSYDLNTRTAVMGCVNLSRDSVYRDSIAVSADSAIRKARVLAAQGADLIDLGAESSTASASRVEAQAQTAALVPVVSALADEGIKVSVETYHADVARACLAAGAALINYSGGEPLDAAMFSAVAEADAALLLCFIPGTDARDRRSLGGATDLIPVIHEQFTQRVGVAREYGVTNIVIDPGIGFAFDASAGPMERIRQQTATLLQTVRLRDLGLPICHSLPNAFDLFEDQFRTAEGFFAVLAFLGGCGVYRTHEVAQVCRVLRALSELSTT